MKVLLSAYACEPGIGSEPAVGWNVVREVVKYHQVWVLTSNCHRLGIETELQRNPIPNLHFVYLDPFGWVLDWSQEGKKTQWGVQFHYYLWQILAYFVGRSLHEKIGFDIAHHVTYVKYSAPSFISLLPIPFLWGPVGGGESAPKPFWKDFGSRGKKYETLRNIARWIGERDPFVRLTARRSVQIQATTEDTARRLYQMGARDVKIWSAIGLSPQEVANLSQCQIPDDSTIRFISMGRLLHWKGYHLSLRAFAQADLPDDVEYWILGDGSERERLQQLIEELGIASKVKLWGKLSREECFQKLKDCHVLVHPSLHDSGGGVCLEAMAAGRPVICLNLGGPAIQVTEQTGLKVSAVDPEQAVNDLASAMSRIAREPRLRLRMAEAGRKLVCEFYNWDNKGKQLTQTYQAVLNSASN